MKIQKMHIALIIMVSLIIFSVFTFIKTGNGKLDVIPITHNIIKNMKLNTLTYQYTDSIFIVEEEVWKLFGLIDIAPGTRYLAVQYDGVIELGVDFGIDAEYVSIVEQGVDSLGKTKLVITLPKAKELSHEQFRNDEITLFEGGKLTNKKVSRVKLNLAYGERKEAYTKNARSLGLYEQAEKNAISQLENLFNMIPAITNNYSIEWRWH